MLYTYVCQKCEHKHEAERYVADRNTVPCPECEAPPSEQLIQIQLTGFSMAHQDRMISDAECEGRYGKDWRETPGSRRMMTDTAERTYSGAGGKK